MDLVIRPLVVALLGGCGGAAARPTPPPPEAVAGVWALTDGSTTVMRVSGTPPALTVEAWADRSKVHFVVSDVAMEGRRLRVTFRYPPNGVTTTSDLELVNSDRLEGPVTGAYQARETWLRTGN